MGKKSFDQNNSSKYHIAMCLNLENPSDLKIFHLIQSKPDYVSVPAFIKNAITYYCENALGQSMTPVFSGITQTSASSGVPEEKPRVKRAKTKPQIAPPQATQPQVVQPQVVHPQVVQPQVVNHTTVANPTVTDDVMDLPAKSPTRQKPDSEPLTKEDSLDFSREKEEHAAHEIVVENNSDIKDNVDYGSYIDNLFNS